MPVRTGELCTRHPPPPAVKETDAPPDARTPSPLRETASVSGRAHRSSFSPFMPTITVAVAVAVLPAASVAVYSNV